MSNINVRSGRVSMQVEPQIGGIKTTLEIVQWSEFSTTETVYAGGMEIEVPQESVSLDNIVRALSNLSIGYLQLLIARLSPPITVNENSLQHRIRIE